VGLRSLIPLVGVSLVLIMGLLQPASASPDNTDALLYSSFFGDIGADFCIDTVRDSEGNLGRTTSESLPGHEDLSGTSTRASTLGVFVTKVDPEDMTIIETIIISGDGHEWPFGISIDNEDHLTVVGETTSTDLPITSDALQSELRGERDAFIMTIDIRVMELIFSTYFGGDDIETAYAVEYHGGDLVVGGFTKSPDFPTTPDAPQQAICGTWDAFYLKILDEGRELAISSFLGGNGYDNIRDIAVTDDGLVFLGETESSDLVVTTDAIQEEFGGQLDMFLISFTSDLRTIQYSTYIGGWDEENPCSLLLDDEDRVIVSGMTSSREILGITWDDMNREILLLTLSRDLRTVLDVVILGGSDHESLTDVVVGSLGEIYLCGATTSDDLPVTEDVFQPETGGSYDAFVMRLSQNGTSVDYSTYLGSFQTDVAVSIIPTGHMALHVFGWTRSSTFPITDDATQTTFEGIAEVFIATIATYVDRVPPIAATGPDETVDQHTSVLLNGSASSDNVGIVEYSWSFSYNGSQVELDGESVLYTFDEAGSYEITLSVIDGWGNRMEDIMMVTILDVSEPVADAGPDLFADQGEAVTFDGTNSTDNVGLVEWQWMFEHGGEVVLEEARVDFTFEIAGIYTVTLIVKDARGNSATDSLVVNVRDVTSPIAVAGPDRIVDQGEEIQLEGSQSTDDVGIVNWTWTVDGGHVQEGEEITISFLEAGTYHVTLVVEDVAGNDASDTVLVTVNDITPPSALAGEDVVTNVDTKVVLNGSSSSDDVGITSWIWTFTYDGADKRFEGETTEFEFRMAGTYEVTLTVTDGAGNEAEDVLVVKVRDDKETFGSGFLLLTILMVFAVALAGYFLLRKRL